MKRALLVSFVALAALAGCDRLNVDFLGERAPPTAPPPVVVAPAMAAVEAAPPGAVETVDDPDFGGTVEISVLQQYAAASGRDCKRVTIRNLATGRLSSRVACAGSAGWYWTAASIT